MAFWDGEGPMGCKCRWQLGVWKMKPAGVLRMPGATEEASRPAESFATAFRLNERGNDDGSEITLLEKSKNAKNGGREDR